MICTTLHNKSGEELIEALALCEMAEIRLDRCDLSDYEIEQCFLSDVPTVATCRIKGIMEKDPSLSETAAALLSEKKLIKAIVSGAKYADVEIEAPKSMVKRVSMAAKENGTILIRSYHDYTGTGTDEELRDAVEKCRYHGGEIVKIVTTAVSEGDADRVMSLYDSFASSGLIAFCMGEKGRGSRLLCLKKGAPFTYAALSEGELAASGQPVLEEIMKAVYGGRKFFGYDKPAASGAFIPLPSLKMPSSKSFAQRAILAAALSKGLSKLYGYSDCGDNSSAVSFAESLGSKVTIEGDVLTIEGAGPEEISKALSHSGTVDAGESGLLARLAIPLVAALSPCDVKIEGKKTLLDRHLSGVSEIMEKFGVAVKSSDGNECKVPLTVSGSLIASRTEFSGKNGSQLISGLLMALPLLEKNSTFTVSDPVSLPYMFITVDILKKFGVKISDEMLGGNDFMLSEGSWDFCEELVFKVKGGQKYTSTELTLEGDWSTAANFLVAGAVFGRVEVSGLDIGSLQADLSIMDILMDAGASISQYDGEDGVIAVQRSPLWAFSVDAKDCPDLFPVLAVLASFCQGTSVIGGVSRLVHKESDRGKAIVDMLHRMGVEASVEEDSLKITGMSFTQRILTGNLLKGGKYTSCHDHRMAMALTVASLGADSPIEIDDTECVAKSCPSFFDLFSKLL